MPKNNNRIITELSPYQFEIFEGLMLGDGCLRKPKTNTNLYIKRALKDLGHLKWEAEIFKEFVSPRGIKIGGLLDKRTKKYYSKCDFLTRSLPCFLKQYQRWYPDGKKRIPLDLKLTPTIIAKWFVDDGHVHKNFNGGLRCSLATQAFSKDEVDFLVNQLESFIPNGHFGLPRNLSKDGKRYQYKICFGGDTARLFLLLIDSVFPPLERKSSVWRNESKWLYKRVTHAQCPKCNSFKTWNAGERANHKKRYHCQDCGLFFIEPKIIREMPLLFDYTQKEIPAESTGTFG